MFNADLAEFTLLVASLEAVLIASFLALAISFATSSGAGDHVVAVLPTSSLRLRK